MRLRLAAMFLLVPAVLTLGCRHSQPPPKAAASPIDYGAELPPGTLALRKLSPSEYPDFSGALAAFNVADLQKSLDASLGYLAKPTSQKFFPYEDISHERAVASLQALRQILVQCVPAGDGKQFDATIKNTFEVYKSIGAPAGGEYTGKVLFTGYFTPIYNASLTQGGLYQYPLYKRPPDLVMDSAGEHAWRKLPDAQQVPYYTRQEIDQNHALAGQELVWVADKFDAYVISIQGSARLRLEDGRIYEIGYNGNNGYDYASPGRQMVADGVLPKEQLTLKGLRDFFHAHPEMMDRYLPLNRRFIFFAERPGGPFGSLNVPVTAFATIATDKSVYPRAMPAFLVAPVPSPQTGGLIDFRGLMFDQDTGGGIRASGRCDIFMGIGPAAEQLAGQELHAGELYYLAIRPELMAK